MSPGKVAIAVTFAALFGSFIGASADEHEYSGVFVISDISVSKDAAYENYRKAVKPAIENCGATYVVRAGAKFVTDNPTSGILYSSGDWNPDRIVVLHFDSVEQADACFSSPEYEAAYALREGGASGKTLIVDAYRPD